LSVIALLQNLFYKITKMLGHFTKEHESSIHQC